MTDKILTKDKLSAALEELAKFRLMAPTLSDEVVLFKQVTDPAEVTLDYANSTVPPKRVVFPQTETLFKFEEGKAELEEKTGEEEGPTVIFGLRPCDARAMAIVEKLFSWDYDDPYYLRRRELTTLVGLACSEPPSVNCFCTSVGGSPAGEEGLDVLLSDLGDKYLVRGLTDKGEKLLAAIAGTLEDAAAGDADAAAGQAAEAAGKIARTISIEGMQEKLPTLWENPLWAKASAACLGCGTCTYLCPTCHCFDIQDEVEDDEGRRARMWDSCMFCEYTLHGSGHNPRPTRKERTRNRINHKYSYFPSKFGDTACVGCGRCINLCPVNIDILDILEQVVDA
ncbi:MAG: 4Fe-4S dicluster domain-containing protein [Candidatus Geothermincolia bacterium]